MGITKFSFETVEEIEGLHVITPFIAEDDRGAFKKVYEKNIFLEHGIDLNISEVDESISKKGVIRGLHMQHTRPQPKLVRVVYGEVFDVAVDVRKNSKTFGKYFGIYLSGENRKMLYIPAGFLHGLLCLRDGTVFSYPCFEDYLPDYDGGVIWNDPDIAIGWPKEKVDKIILSEKDRKLPTLAEYIKTV
ncbi:dTDP-4-dehydrorhamnose 3,5-epimerase [Caproiciproducens sp.]|uniref:dTDP-4-dehydrorhamnose 3,5-epimerase n=1 Tax=Caproiciproducens sp. TaxID=1954376 RepID=UPI002897E688|nr:dTDP-4-dehydrorhamnose 3,5-epimerase [Caproiciproducens sp.]